MKKEKDLLERLKQLPDGEQKAKETKGQIDLIWNFIVYREYPKYGMVSRYFVYKQSLMKEAEQLLRAGAIVGLSVSSGVIEGKARVILKMEYGTKLIKDGIEY